MLGFSDLLRCILALEIILPLQFKWIVMRHHWLHKSSPSPKLDLVMRNQLVAVQIVAEMINLHYEIPSPLDGFPNIEFFKKW